MIRLTAQDEPEGSVLYSVVRDGRELLTTREPLKVLAILAKYNVIEPDLLIGHVRQWKVVEILEHS